MPITRTPEKAPTPYLQDLVAGDLDPTLSIRKFGHNHTVGTSAYTPICEGGVYQTPQVSGATTLRIKSGGHANDTAAGTGAREVTVYGVDATGNLVEEAIATAGASASSATTATFIRLFRIKVTASGAYATATAGSHDAAIVIENGSGGTDWGTLPFDSFPFAQSQIGVYTVPLGFQAFIYDYHIIVDSGKTIDVLLFQRQGILETSAPYMGMTAIEEVPGVAGAVYSDLKIPLGPYPELTDLGFMAKANTSTGACSVKFSLLCTPT